MTSKSQEDEDKEEKPNWWDRQSGRTQILMVLGGGLGLVLFVTFVMLTPVDKDLIAFPPGANDSTVTSDSIVSNVSTDNDTTSNVDKKTQEDDFWKEYRRGEYTGYIQGYDDGLYGEDYNDYLTKGTNIAEGHRIGYKAGYRSGYEDAKAGKEMKLPSL